jgi:carboxypeptidase C (cathepsin A)
MWFIKSLDNVDGLFSPPIVLTGVTTTCVLVAIGLAIYLSNPRAKTVEELRLQREIIVDSLENTTSKRLYAKSYVDAEEFNKEKQHYESRKDSLWVGCFQDKRYEYISLNNNKRFEIRKNDCNYQVGDIVKLVEYNSDKQVETNSYIVVKITYILKDIQQYGLDKDYCIFGFIICEKMLNVGGMKWKKRINTKKL